MTILFMTVLLYDYTFSPYLSLLNYFSISLILFLHLCLSVCLSVTLSIRQQSINVQGTNMAMFLSLCLCQSVSLPLTLTNKAYMYRGLPCDR